MAHNPRPKVAGKGEPSNDRHVDSGKEFQYQSYPATCEFASRSSENANLVHEGMRCRRPGGMYRGPGPWHTICHAPEVDEPIRGHNGNPD